MWRVISAEDLRKNDVLSEVYYELRDKLWYFFKRDEGIELTDDELDREFSQYLIEIWVTDTRIYFTAGKTAKDLANQPPWITVEFFDIGDIDETLQAITELPEE